MANVIPLQAMRDINKGRLCAAAEVDARSPTRFDEYKEVYCPAATDLISQALGEFERRRFSGLGSVQKTRSEAYEIAGEAGRDFFVWQEKRHADCLQALGRECQTQPAHPERAGENVVEMWHVHGVHQCWF